MRIRDKLWGTIVLLALLYVGLVAVIELTQHQLRNFSDVAARESQLERHFLVAKALNRSFPQDGHTEAAIRAELRGAQTAAAAIDGVGDAGIGRQAQHLQAMLALYQADFGRYAGEVERLKTERRALKEVVSEELAGIVAINARLGRRPLLSDPAARCLEANTRIYGWLNQLLESSEMPAVPQSEFPKYIAGIDMATARIGQVREEFRANAVKLRDISAIAYADKLAATMKRISELSARVVAQRRKMQELRLDAQVTEQRISLRITDLQSATAQLGREKYQFLSRIQWFGAGSIVLLAIVVSTLVVRSITTPLRHLLTHVNLIADGHLDRELPVRGSDELAQLGQAFNRMTAQLGDAFRRITADGVRLAEINRRLGESLGRLRDTQTELRASEAKYSQLFEFSSDATMILTDSYFSDCNSATLKIFGYPDKQEFCALHPGDVSPSHQPDGEKSHIAADRHIRRALAEGYTQFEWLHKRRDGTVFPAEVLLTAFKIGDQQLVQASVRDITIRKQAESDLKRNKEELERRVQERTAELLKANRTLKAEIDERTRAEQQLRMAAKVFENASEGIVITDGDGVILDVNGAFAQIMGRSRQEILGTRLPLVEGSGYEREMFESLQAALTTEHHWQGELLAARDSGELFPCWVSIAAIREPDAAISNFVAIYSDITELKQAQENLRQMAHYDVLTGLPNRNLMQDRVEHSIRLARRNGDRMALMLLDLDRFKYVNDSLGHDAGDQLLIEVAKRLADGLRGSDTVARLGGDEFTIIINDIHFPEDAARVARHVLDSLRSPFRIRSKDIFISASIGIAMFPDDAESSLTLIKHADAAMYHAKGQGKNNYQFFSGSLNARSVEYLEMESRLRHAVDHQEFSLFYQPQINVVDGSIVGLEALIRWQNSGGHFVAPESFIPIAEDTGLIVPIGEWVIGAACRQAMTWREQGLAVPRIAVNLSGRQFKHNDLVRSVSDILDSTGLPASLLEVEITETALMEEHADIMDVVTELKRLGIGFAIDDFGTGYSSLSYLRRFPVDRLKVDRSFVKDVAGDPDDAAIANAVIALAHSLNLEVIAEGVENAEQCSFLRRSGCELMQGYYFDRPLPAPEVARRLGGQDRISAARPSA